MLILPGIGMKRKPAIGTLHGVHGVLAKLETK